LIVKVLLVPGLAVEDRGVTLPPDPAVTEMVGEGTTAAEEEAARPRQMRSETEESR
jgi:hypothetical protein